jgi:hypothetical protein
MRLHLEVGLTPILFHQIVLQHLEDIRLLIALGRDGLQQLVLVKELLLPIKLVLLHKIGQQLGGLEITT